MKPRVVVLSAFLTPLRSGAEACVEEIAVRLSDRYDITIVTARLRSDLPRTDRLRGVVNVIRVGFGCAFDKWLYPFLAPFAAWTLRPDLVHAVLETFAGLALHLCRFTVPQAKRLLTLQTLNRSFLKGPVVRSAHAVTAISGALQRVAADLDRRDVTLIPNGIDVTEIRAACERHSKVKSRILFVGRLELMKGVDTLLDAFATIASEFPQAHLRIVGDGSLHPKLKSQVSELVASGRVTFLGYLPPPAVYNEFAQAQIFCALSRSEALGNVFLEAQAAGCAVVGTSVGGIPEVVCDGVSGLIVPPDDIPAATKAMRRLLKDDALRAELVEHGKQHAEQYDWGVIAEQYAGMYRELLP